MRECPWCSVVNRSCCLLDNEKIDIVFGYPLHLSHFSRRKYCQNVSTLMNSVDFHDTMSSLSGDFSLNAQLFITVWKSDV